jgi:signal transduction histidine kinase
LRHRILLTIIAITALAITGFGVPLGIAISSSYHNSARLELQREASAASTAVPASFATAVDQVELPADDADTTLGLYDAGGRLVAGAGPATADKVVLAAMAGTASDGTTGGDVVATAPVSDNEVVVGVVRAARAESAVRGQILGAWGLMAVLGVAVIGAAAAVATWQARRLSRPLDQLTTTARRLGDGDFTVRTSTSGFKEIDDAGQALDRTAERLGTMIKRERQFSADVSHQLRTPLTALRLDLDNALTTPGVDPDDAIRSAFESMDRMEATIDDLMALRRGVDADAMPLDLHDLLSEMEASWRGPLAEEGRLLRVSAPVHRTPLPVSTAAMRQILAVLVSNAVEHGGGAVSITASFGSHEVAVEVSDEGDGFDGDPDLLLVRRADRQTDRGIGLPLARSLAEAEGGRLVYAVTPAPTFTVMIPFRTGAQTPP